MKDNKEKKINKTSTGIENNIIQILTVTFIIVLVGANLFGLYFVYSVFSQITQKTTSTASTDATQLVSPFNTTLYKTIQTDRLGRLQYTVGSNVPHYSFNEVFTQGGN